MLELESSQPTAEAKDSLELALKSVYPEKVTPTLGDFRKNLARLAELEQGQ